MAADWQRKISTGVIVVLMQLCLALYTLNFCFFMLHNDKAMFGEKMNMSLLSLTNRSLWCPYNRAFCKEIESYFLLCCYYSFPSLFHHFGIGSIIMPQLK